MDAIQSPPWNPALCDAQCKAAQAAWVLDQVTVTNRLAANAANTTQGYFLGSCFFQHSFVDASNYEAWDVVPGSFATRNASPTAPFPAAGKSWRIDVLKPLPVWTSVMQGYASVLPDDDDAGPMIDEPAGAVR